jgi:ATP-dependent helicase HrpA
VGDEAVYAFYDARIPPDVFDVRSFEAWWRDAASRTPRLLDMTEADLLDDAARADERDFPTRWQQGDQVLALSYRFEPGAVDDGVTAVVPLALLAQLRPEGFDWQVPGLRDELITALLRSLPKAIRRHVVPAADWAARFAEDLDGQGPESNAGNPPTPLREALAVRIQRVANQPVTAADFELERVPDHLRVSFRVVDERGRPISSDRDLPALQLRLSDRARTSVEKSLSRSPEGRAGKRSAHDEGGSAYTSLGRPEGITPRSGITDWDLGALPDVVDTKVAGGIVRGYPALIDEGRSVALRVEATPEAAARATRAGVRRLLLLAVPSPATYVLEHLTSAEKLALATSPYPSAKALVEDARVAVADAVIAREMGSSALRTRADFERVRDALSAVVVDETFRAVSLASRILTSARDVDRAVRAQNSLTLLGALRDVRGQVAGLVFPGFVSRIGSSRLVHVPRYLQGALERVEGLADNPGRDRQRMTEFERAAVSYSEAGGSIPGSADEAPALERTRWLLEEYRVSLFAQHLGTAEPVSLQRIQKSLRE